MKPDLSTLDLKALGQDFQALRTESSHYNDGEWNERVDPSSSEKALVMKELATRLGVPGTSVETVIDAMGDPDEYTRDVNNAFQSPSFMPGPLVPPMPEGAEQAGYVYLCYYWRGRHDFLWFQMREDDETIQSHGWYYALE